MQPKRCCPSVECEALGLKTPIVLSSKIKYENPWISVKEEYLIWVDGSKKTFGTVEMISGVSVLPIDEQGNVYLVNEYRRAIGKESLEAVSGGCRKGENSQEAAIRELAEETGMVASSLTDMGSIDPFTSLINSKNSLFIAEGLRKGDASPDSGEVLELVKISLAEALRLVDSGRITHGATVVLLLKAELTRRA